MQVYSAFVFLQRIFLCFSIKNLKKQQQAMSPSSPLPARRGHRLSFDSVSSDSPLTRKDDESGM